MMMKKRTTMMGASVLLLVVGLGVAVYALQRSASDILTAAAETVYAAEDGHAVIELSGSTPEQSGSATVEVWGRRLSGEGEDDHEHAFRLEVLESSFGNAGMTAVSDGVQVWLWHPGENKVLTGTIEEFKAQREMSGDYGEYDGYSEFAGEHPDTPEEAVAKLLEYFTADIDGEDVLAVGEATRLRLLPIPEQMPEQFAMAGGWVNVWVDGDDVPVAVEYTGGAMGEARATATLVELNVGLSDDLFTFEIPDGAEVVNVADLQPESITLDEAAAAGMLAPTDLPEGATLVDVLEMSGAVVQRYALPDGGSFTLAQSSANADYPTPSENGEAITVRGNEGMLYANAEGRRVMLAWTEGETAYWIGGDLTTEQAIAIAESLE